MKSLWPPISMDILREFLLWGLGGEEIQFMYDGPLVQRVWCTQVKEKSQAVSRTEVRGFISEEGSSINLK